MSNFPEFWGYVQCNVCGKLPYFLVSILNFRFCLVSLSEGGKKQNYRSNLQVTTDLIFNACNQELESEFLLSD